MLEYVRVGRSGTVWNRME